MSEDQKGSFVLSLVGQAVPSNGGLGQIVNPEGVDLIITSCALHVTTASAGAANINIGTGEAGADNSGLISALAINGAIGGKAYNGLNPAAKSELLVWAAGKYLNATGSAACTAFRGEVHIKYDRI